MVEQAANLASFAHAATQLLTLVLAAAAGSALITSCCAAIHFIMENSK